MRFRLWIAATLVAAALTYAAIAFMRPGFSPHESHARLLAHAERVVYIGGGSREWGTFCRLPGGGWLSVAHVTANGTPVVGPTAAVVASDAASDWAFIGVDPAALDAEAVPALAGDVILAGYPARDRDGEVVPGRVYIADTTPPFVWVELFDSPADGIAAEGVVGGFSGSCVLVDGKVAGTVHANGFSRIEGTTSTWALVVPLRAAILEAQGRVAYDTPPLSFAPGKPLPQRANGRWQIHERGAR